MLGTKLCESYDLEVCTKETNPNRICKLQETYDASEVPVNDKITIKSTANIFDIFNVDEKDHFIAIYLQMEYDWVDPRLYYSNLTEKYMINYCSILISYESDIMFFYQTLHQY